MPALPPGSSPTPRWLNQLASRILLTYEYSNAFLWSILSFVVMFLHSCLFILLNYEGLEWQRPGVKSSLSHPHLSSRVSWGAALWARQNRVLRASCHALRCCLSGDGSCEVTRLARASNADALFPPGEETWLSSHSAWVQAHLLLVSQCHPWSYCSRTAYFCALLLMMLSPSSPPPVTKQTQLSSYGLWSWPPGASHLLHRNTPGLLGCYTQGKGGVLLAQSRDGLHFLPQGSLLSEMTDSGNIHPLELQPLKLI